MEHAISLYIISGGLFQVYYEPNELYENYEDMKKKIIHKLSKNFEKNSIIEIQNIFSKYEVLKENDKNISPQEIKEKIDTELKPILNNQTPENIFFNISNFQTIPLQYLVELLSKYKIYFIHKNLLDLYIDYSIMKCLNLNNIDNIVFSLEYNQSIKSQIESSPKTSVIFDFNLVNLLQYHIQGCITVYLTHLLKTLLSSTQNKDYFDELNNSNLDVIREHQTFFTFSIFFFIQLKNYLPILSKVSSQLPTNKFDNVYFKNEFSKMGHINALLLYRYFYKLNEIKRAHLFISNDKVNYISYVGSLGQEGYDDLLDIGRLHGNINCIIPKFSDAHEVTQYQKIIKTIIEYTKKHPNVISMTNLSNIGIYLERNKMIKYMNDFIAVLNEPKAKLPLSYSVKLLDVYEYDQFVAFMKENNLKLPVILKYEGPEARYNHLLINIITDTGLKNYISFMKDFSKGNENKITQIVQSFVNHGGYVIKGYYINGKSYFYYRPSFPDVSEGLVSKYDEYSRGFYQTTTSDLIKDKFKEFWKKITKNSKIKELVDEKFMDSIMQKHRVKSGDTLFGIDFLFDFEGGIYYVIDVNQFPGYKELIPEFNDIITEHTILYTKKE